MVLEPLELKAEAKWIPVAASASYWRFHRGFAVAPLLRHDGAPSAPPAPSCGASLSERLFACALTAAPGFDRWPLLL